MTPVLALALFASTFAWVQAHGQSLPVQTRRVDDRATLLSPPLGYVADPSTTLASIPSVVFDKRSAAELRSRSNIMTLFVEGTADSERRKPRLPSIEARFASALDVGSPELITGKMYGGCMYTGLGFSCPSPIDSILLNARSVSRFR